MARHTAGARIEAYNLSLGSFEARLLTSRRKIRDLGEVGEAGYTRAGLSPCRPLRVDEPRAPLKEKILFSLTT